MKLPAYVRNCIALLESAGYPAYVVGGCVRDARLGLEPKDYDLCTAASPEEMERLFSQYPLVLCGKAHGTVGVVVEGDVLQITTFRAEGGYRDHRHPDWVRFVPRVEADLARRDFTVNAMAFSPTRGLIDPFGGRQDLERRILRAVGDPEQRFQEDPLRILRGVRFAAVYRLEPETASWAAMVRQAPLMDGLARERVFAELCGLLPWMEWGDLLRFQPILTAVIPELAPMVGFDQRSPYHAYDLYTHTAHVVASVPRDLPLRWAALLHDLGKVGCFTLDESGRGHFYGHASLGAEQAVQVLTRLKAPAALRRQVEILIRQHMTPLEADKTFLRRRLSRLGWDTLRNRPWLQEADTGSKGSAWDKTFFPRLRQLLQELRREQPCLRVTDLAVNGRDLMALGYQGKALGQCLNHLLEQVLSEALPNEKPALLAAAAARFQKGADLA